MNGLPTLQRIEADARALFFIDALVTVALLGLIVWGIVWTIGVVRRWESRQEAQTRALIRIAASFNKPTNEPTVWADTKPGE